MTKIQLDWWYGLAGGVFCLRSSFGVKIIYYHSVSYLWRGKTNLLEESASRDTKGTRSTETILCFLCLFVAKD